MCETWDRKHKPQKERTNLRNLFTPQSEGARALQAISRTKRVDNARALTINISMRVTGTVILSEEPKIVAIQGANVHAKPDRSPPHTCDAVWAKDEART